MKMQLTSTTVLGLLSVLVIGCGPSAGPATPPATVPAPAVAPVAAAGQPPVQQPAPAPAAQGVPSHGHQNPAGQPMVGNHTHDGVGEHLHSAQGGAVSVAEARQRSIQADYFAELAQVHLKFNSIGAAILSLEKSLELGRSIGNENAMRYRQCAEAYRRKGDGQAYARNLGIALRIYTTLHQDPKRAKVADYYREQLSIVSRDLGDTDRALWWADRIGEGSDEQTLQMLAVKAKLYRLNAQPERALKMLQEAEGKAETKMQEAISLEIAGLQLDARENKPAIKRLVALAKSAKNDGVKTQAKRLLISIYDKLGQLDKLVLGDLDLGAEADPKDDGKSDGDGDGDDKGEDDGSKDDESTNGSNNGSK